MTTLYLVRHGESEGNIGVHIDMEARKLGLGSPLSPEGKEQAKRRGEDFRNIPFSIAYTSNSLRAIQTAEIIIGDKSIPQEIDDNLHEINPPYHRDEINSKMKDVMNEFQSLAEEEKFSYKLFDDMESAKEMGRRMYETVQKITRNHDGETILLISHGHIMRSFLIFMGFATYSELPSNSLENTGYFILDHDGEKFSIREVHGLHKKVT